MWTVWCVCDINAAGGIEADEHRALLGFMGVHETVVGRDACQTEGSPIERVITRWYRNPNPRVPCAESPYVCASVRV